jgi:hypothetical protein
MDICRGHKGVLGDLAIAEPDGAKLLVGQGTAVEDKQQLVALVWMGCPIHSQKAADPGPDPELFEVFPLAC